jgi:hypothetical protein
VYTIKLKRQIHFKYFSFVLILLLCFKLSTINENIKYNIASYPHEKVTILNSYNEDTKILVLLNRRNIYLESYLSVKSTSSINLLFQLLYFKILFIFIQIIFDIRKRISKLIISSLNGSTYKNSLYFS